MELPLIGTKVDRRIPWVVGLITAGLLATSTGTYVVMHRMTPKSDIAELTVPVESKNVTVRITASGEVKPIQSVNLSPKAAGILKQLLVEQGDQVQQGQIIALMDDAELQAQLAQNKANLAQAEAQLAKLRAGSRPEEIAQARARLAQAEAQLAEAKAGSRSEDIAQARARLAQAEAQLRSVQTANPQEIAAAQAQVNAAQARVDLARKKVKLYSESLVTQGAITRERLEEVKTDEQTALASLQEAQRRLAQVQTGRSPAEIAQRQAAVAEARQALEERQNGTRPEIIAQRQASVTEAKQALEQLENGSRKEDIAQAQAAVAEARGRLQAVQVQLDDKVIRAPFSGIVTQKYANVGAFVAPVTSGSNAAAAAASIVGLARGLEILARVPEVDIGQITLNQSVEIEADAYPDQVFKGRVRLIAPEAVVNNNVTSFEVRVALDTGKEELRSGMNVNLTFLGKELSNALVVPTVAIVTQKGEQGVMIPGSDNKPEFRPVTIGPTIGNETQILQGINEGDRVFIDLPKDNKAKPNEKS